MADLNDLMPHVRTHLSGSTDAMIIIYLRRASKQFCQDSGVWELSMGSKSVSPPADSDDLLTIPIPDPPANPDADPPVPDPDFVIPANSYVNRVSKVILDDDALDISTYAYNIVSQALELRPRTVRNQQDLEVYAVLEPTRATNAIPDFLFERWGEGIADYCIWEMMSMIGREWSAPKLALTYKAKYENRVAEAKVGKARKGTSKEIRLTPIEFV